MIDRQWAEAHLPIVLMMLQGNNVSFVERSGSKKYSEPFAIDPATMQTQPLYIETMYGLKPNTNIAPNSVGILPFTGPITKYNGSCGEPGTIERANWLMDMMKRDNIGSVIQLMDTPGGEVSATNTYLSVAIKNQKPILSFIEGMNASLGVWFTSASTEVYLSNEMDEFGSIGSYATLMDVRGYFEKEGIKLHEIYAPQSVDKNKNVRDALAGDYSAIEADLKKHVDHFISFVSNSRNGKAAATKDQWGTGKMFYAADAVKLGLADGIKPFDQVVSKAAWLAKRHK